MNLNNSNTEIQDVSDCIEDTLVNDLDMKVRTHHYECSTTMWVQSNNANLKIIILEDK